MYCRASAAALRIAERHAVRRGVADAVGLTRRDHAGQLLVGLGDEFDRGAPSCR